MDRRTEKTTPEQRGQGGDRTEIIASTMEQDPGAAEIAGRTGLPESQVTGIASRPGPVIRQLNQRQARVLAFIREYTARHPYPPTLREIVEGCGLSSASVALYNLRVLARNGYVTRIPNTARGIVLTGQGWSWTPESQAKEPA